MVYTVSTDMPPQLTLGENDTLKSVLQNVYLILATRKKTVPMYRHFGLPMAFIDKPILAAETISAAEIREAIADFEPRAKLVDVSYEPSEYGAKLSVKVEVGV
jgi:phage baseplate assembly protein W